MKKVRPLKMPHDRAVKALYEVLDNLFEIDRYWEDVPKVYGEAVAHMCRGEFDEDFEADPETVARARDELIHIAKGYASYWKFVARELRRI